MENEDGGQYNPNATPGLPAASNVPNNQAKKPNKGRNTAQKSDAQQKKSYRRSWRSSSPVRKLEIIILAIGAAVGIGYLGTMIWGNLQTSQNFATEHRPRVVFSRPPELLGTVECQITDKAIYLHMGAMRIWVKNNGHGEANGAFVAGPMLQLVPEKPIGLHEIDDVPSIDDQFCNQKFSPKMKEFPVGSGEEVSVDMRQAMGAQSLIKTNSISVTFGGPQKEPEATPGQASAGIIIDKDAIFQLYAPVCVIYTAEDGTPYASCRNYRMAVDGQLGSSDEYGFSCTHTPIHGSFEQTLFGYCQK